MFNTRYMRWSFQQISRYSTLSEEATRVGIIGVPFNFGQDKKGVENGPKSLRETGIIQDLEDMILDVKDGGDISYVPFGDDVTVEGMKNLNHFASCVQEVSKRVEGMIRNNRKCLTFGGDHSIAVGTIDGHIKAVGEDKVAVVWIDAHADLNTYSTTPTGHIHGMPVGLLAKELTEEWPVPLPGMDWMTHPLSLMNLGYIGLRAVDRAERQTIDRYGVTAFGMDDIERYGIHNVVQLMLQKIDPNGNKSIHISFDIDSLDELEAPSTGTSVRGGLTLRECLHIMERLHQTKRVTAVDIVEVNASLGSERDVAKTLEAARYLILAAFGHCRLGYNLTGPLY